MSDITMQHAFQMLQPLTDKHLGENLLRHICYEYNILIEQHYFRSGSFNAMLWSTGGQYTVLINAELPHTRWNFTLAHEIGHWFLHRNMRTSFQCTRPWGRTYDPIEREANAFAAELLMPRKLILGWIASGRDAKKIAREFRVSEEAVKYRIKELVSR